MKTESKRGKVRIGLGRGFYFWSGLFVALLVLMALAFYQGSQQERLGREYGVHASALRLLSQQMTTQGLAAAQGSDTAFLQLRQLRSEFERHLKALLNGDEASGMPPLPAELTPELSQINRQWQRYRRDIDAILAGRESVARARAAIQQVQAQLPALVEASQTVADKLRQQRRARPQVVYLATRQLSVIRAIENELKSLLSGDAASLEAADALSRDVARFSTTVDALLNGDPKQGIRRVTDRDTRAALADIVNEFGAIADEAGTLVEVAPALYKIRTAAAQLAAAGRSLFEGTSRLEGAIVEQNRGAQLWTTIGFVLGGLALALFLYLVSLVIRVTRAQLRLSKETNDRNQRAILTLLDEMATLADGDLTVNATVTEDITGAIADSVNYAIEALRTLVVTIRNAASRVARTAEKARNTAIRMAESSEKQARKIVSASDSINDLTESIGRVSRNAATSAKVADQSLALARKGVETVNLTKEGMNTIREQIQDTSKRIKRLGESSQEIGDIVGLITDIADQTNILALNAAIQASSAGEGGRGFAVVADEVQRLAERASNASKQIEALVKTIQADTSEAIQSMEKSTANVVAGTRRADEAGNALSEIERVTHQLAELIKGISEEAREQAIVSSVVAEAMSTIQDITRQTVESTRETSLSVSELVEHANELRKSVEGFKLPEDAADQLEEGTVFAIEQQSAAADETEGKSGGEGEVGGLLARA